MPAYLRPSGEIAPAVVLPGDPARAMALAQDLLAEPRMVNHARGLWGYSDAASPGAGLTIQASGIGGASAAAVLRDLAEHGVTRVVRVGACAALDGGLSPGTLLVATGVHAQDGTSRALGAAGWLEPHATLSAALVTSLGPRAQSAAIASADLLGGPEAESERARALAAGASAVDHSTAALLAFGARLGVAVASGLVVSESGGERLGDHGLATALGTLGRAAASALRPQRSERTKSRVKVEG